ncbi:MAG: hypothetical protein JWP89_6151 [Schlesneria sp.]|nr:hypothetical protein [Schlesneria sp.]
MDMLIVLGTIWLAPPLLYTTGVLVLDVPQRSSALRIIWMLAPAAVWLIAWALLSFIMLYPSL